MAQARDARPASGSSFPEYFMSNLFVSAALGAFAFVAAASGAPESVAAQGEVNVVSYRQPYLIEPLFKAFTDKTGIKVNTIYAKDGLIERIAADGENSPADLLLTVDIGRLSQSVEEGVTQPVKSETLEAAIPAAYRDPDGQWFALTRRARVIYASKDRVAQDEITYEELADPKWKGKICTRSGQHDYNIALIASMIAHLGKEKAEAWLKGVKANLAVKPGGNDRSQVKSIFAGECDISLGNTYYMAQMRLNEEEPEQKDWASAVKVLFPNVGDRGAHVNVSGVVMIANAPNRDNALKLMEYLVSDDAQRIYAEVNYEYPVKDGVPVSDMVKSFGELKADQLSLDAIAENRKAASEMVDRVGFDEGPSS
jgi:iron(III) transport system substrate-binding protein